MAVLSLFFHIGHVQLRGQYLAKTSKTITYWQEKPGQGLKQQPDDKWLYHMTDGPLKLW